VLIVAHDVALKSNFNAEHFDPIWGHFLANVYKPVSTHMFKNDYKVPDLTFEEIRMVRLNARLHHRSD